MAVLEYIKELKEKNLLLLGISEEGESARYTVSRALYLDIGAPGRGDEIPHGFMEEISDFDEYFRAKKKALSLLSFADNNKRELKIKLLRAGFSKEIADRCVSEMLSLGYINEERQLLRLCLREAEKLRGPRRITASLMAKGYSSVDIHRAIRELCDSGEVDFDKNKALLISKSLSHDAEEDEIKKLLYKAGF